MDSKNIETLLSEAERISGIVNRLVKEITILSNRNKQLERDLSESTWNYSSMLVERKDLLRQIEVLSKKKSLHDN